MKRVFIFSFVLLLYTFVPLMNAQTKDKDFLRRNFDLAGIHSAETQYFIMESQMIIYALNGERQGRDIFRLYLKCVPGEISGKGGDEYTCMKFTVQLGNSAEKEIPALKDWSYIFKNIPSGQDSNGQLFGIEHSRFNNLVDQDGKPVPTDKAYHVYNAFIDFHSICNVFSERAAGGKGIQDLNSIGQKIVHAAAFTEPPVNLGEKIEKGSTFKNGKVTLELKGLSIVNDKECALLEYDSGESSFKMKMKLMPEMEINTVGSSHYKGDIYKDLKSKWVQKANMSEMVVNETVLPMPPYKVNAVIERSILLRNVNENEILSSK